MFFIQLLCKTNLLVGVWWYKPSDWHQYISYSKYNWKHKCNIWKSRDSSIYWLERHVFHYGVWWKFSREHLSLIFLASLWSLLLLASFWSCLKGMKYFFKIYINKIKIWMNCCFLHCVKEGIFFSFFLFPCTFILQSLVAVHHHLNQKGSIFHQEDQLVRWFSVP